MEKGTLRSALLVAVLVYLFIQLSIFSKISTALQHASPLLLGLAAGVVTWFIRRSKKAEPLPHEISCRERQEKIRLGSYPAYPNSWYKLCDSADVPRGTVKEIKALDLVLAVWRENTTEGKVHVFEAFCPHLGANMALGKVKGQSLECPFHLWQFNGEGECAHIPYTDKIPATRAYSFPSREYHGMIILWFHADREEPHYEADIVSEIESGQMTFRGRHYPKEPIKFHLQEFAENSVDYANFNILHGEMCLPFTQIKIPGIRIWHTCDWAASAEKKWIAGFVNKAYLTFFGKKIPKSDGHTTATFLGACGIVHFRFHFEGLGDIVLIQTHLPLEPLSQQTHFQWWADKKVPSLLAWYVSGIWISQVVNDINIWENKIYLQRPGLSGADGPVVPLRRWYKQFYSESSRRRGDRLEW